MKHSIKYILATCILLLSNHSFMYSGSPAVTPEMVSFATQGIVQASDNIFIKSSSFDIEKQSNPLNELLFENDDDEFFSLKKYSVNNNSVLACSARAFGSFSNQRKKALPLSQHLSLTLSCRYLLFQVFRI